MATSATRLSLARSAAASSSSFPLLPSSLLRRPFSSSAPSLADSPPQNIWSALLPPSSSSTSSGSSSNIYSSSVIRTTRPGSSPSDKEASPFLDGPNAKSKADTDPSTDSALLSAQKGLYDSSSPFFNPLFNIAPFSTSPTPLPPHVQQSLALISTPPSPPPPRTPSDLLNAYLSPAGRKGGRRNQDSSYSSQSLPRLSLVEGKDYDDPEVRWTHLAQEFKVFHKKRPGDHFSGRTMTFQAGGVGRVLGRFGGMIAHSKMRTEERHKERFEPNPIRDWRLRRTRHMRRFAVAMRRNVQIVHGLRSRGQSPVR